mmetsp:Transcript_2986/g.9159  ORF Transcript_2986/g.9159 Transcript_2986/m.9159 type:complete len:236 (+) Transcript_2986:808-1515(+)
MRRVRLRSALERGAIGDVVGVQLRGPHQAHDVQHVAHRLGRGEARHGHRARAVCAAHAVEPRHAAWAAPALVRAVEVARHALNGLHGQLPFAVIQRGVHHLDVNIVGYARLCAAVGVRPLHTLPVVARLKRHEGRAEGVAVHLDAVLEDALQQRADSRRVVALAQNAHDGGVHGQVSLHHHHVRVLAQHAPHVLHHLGPPGTQRGRDHLRAGEPVGVKSVLGHLLPPHDYHLVKP